MNQLQGLGAGLSWTLIKLYPVLHRFLRDQTWTEVYKVPHNKSDIRRVHMPPSSPNNVPSK